jgi:phage terminase small subunit
LKQRGLTARQRQFVREYLLCRNAAEAARKAGYSEKNADKIGFILLEKSRVAQAVKEGERKAQAKFEITQEMIVRELALVAFGNIKQVIDANGELVDKDKAAIISSFSKSSSEGREGSSRSFSYSTHNKVKALELLAKHLGMLKDNVAQDPDKSAQSDVLDRLSELGPKTSAG